ELQRDHVGTEHLLAAIAQSEDNPASVALERLGISYDGVLAEVREIGRPTDDVPERLPFTPASKKLLEIALREALSLGHNYIGPEHIALATIRDDSFESARILDKLGAPGEQVRNEIIRALARS